MTIKSPLRYPGGKAKIAKKVHNIIENNNLIGGTYIEPFAGGSGVALYLLSNDYMDRIVMNDYDRSIYAFWYCILNHTEEFCLRIFDTDISVESWDYQKQIQNNKENENIIDLGFSTFFLNRTNRSGRIESGMIGGRAQNGDYLMDCRFNKDVLISQIQSIGALRSRIELYNEDAIQLFRKNPQLINEHTFIYFDPPYYHQGGNLYTNFYRHNDHQDLHNYIQNLNANWIITYDNETEITEMYNEYRQIEFNISYTMERKYVGKEVMIFSNDLTIPPDLF